MDVIFGWILAATVGVIVFGAVLYVAVFLLAFLAAVLAYAMVALFTLGTILVHCLAWPVYRVYRAFTPRSAAG